jgi:sugar lactone lactonase YvrE
MLQMLQHVCVTITAPMDRTWRRYTIVRQAHNSVQIRLLILLWADYDQWPIGIAVASDGRIFTTYTRGSYEYTLGVVVNATAEKPYPNAELNLPPDALNTSWHGISFGSGNASAFISVQALYITSKTATRPETLWVLDTGRPTIHNAQGDPSMPYAQPGGPKLIAISLTNDTIYQTFTFPSTVHYPDSYLNDLRFDLRANVSGTSGCGIAYLVDSSNEGRPGFIMLDLGTGESWRRLTQDQSVLRGQQDLPVYQGHPLYFRQKGMPAIWQQEGLDGIQLSTDGETMYYSPLSANYLYSVPTRNLRARDTDELAEIHAHANVSNHGQRGANANGFEGDTNGFIYQLMPTENAVFYFDPADGQTHSFVKDPRIVWPDGASVGADGYIYLNINQLPYQPDWNNGVGESRDVGSGDGTCKYTDQLADLRQHPGAILRCKLPNGGTKVTSLYP